MKDMEVLTELEQVKAMAVPLRVEIVKILGREPMTTTQVAKVLDEKPNRLYYHVTELEKVGILEVVETRQRGNLVEKYYQPVARLFRIDPGIFGQGAAGQQAFLETAISNFDATILDIRNAIDHKLLSSEEMKKAFSVHLDYTLSPAEAEQLSDELKDLVRKWKDRSPKEGGSRRTHLTMIVYTKKNGEK